MKTAAADPNTMRPGGAIYKNNCAACHRDFRSVAAGERRKASSNGTRGSAGALSYSWRSVLVLSRDLQEAKRLPFNVSLYDISVWVIPLVIAITFHEAAHGFVAHRLG